MSRRRLPAHRMFVWVGAVVALGAEVIVTALNLRDRAVPVPAAPMRAVVSSAPSSSIVSAPSAASVAAMVRGMDGEWVYRCADPPDICEHLDKIGCAAGSSCTALLADVGEDVCSKLFEAKSATAVRALGVTCAPASRPPAAR